MLNTKSWWNFITRRLLLFWYHVNTHPFTRVCEPEPYNIKCHLPHRTIENVLYTQIQKLWTKKERIGTNEKLRKCYALHTHRERDVESVIWRMLSDFRWTTTNFIYCMKGKFQQNVIRLMNVEVKYSLFLSFIWLTRSISCFMLVFNGWNFVTFNFINIKHTHIFIHSVTSTYYMGIQIPTQLHFHVK